VAKVGSINTPWLLITTATTEIAIGEYRIYLAIEKILGRTPRAPTKIKFHFFI
jgi:hypothetical protein